MIVRLAALFVEFFRLSLFVIGGGYAILTVADATCARRGWTKEGELLDQLPVFQTLPGLIATHTAVYVGRKVAGVAGAVTAVAGAALPSLAVFLAVSVCYRSLRLDHPVVAACLGGLRSALTGIVAAAVARSWRRNLPDGFSYALAGLVGIAVGGLSLPVAPVLVGAMAVGLISHFGGGGSAAAGRTFRCAGWLALPVFIKYGLLGFGGGFVLVPMYLEDFVGAQAAWLQLPEGEFSAVMALSQMTPGPIGVNAATFFGYRLAGVGGAVVATAALLLPGSALCYLALSSLDRYRTSRVVRGLMRGIRPSSVALMLVALVEFARMCLFDAEGSFHPGSAALVALVAIASFRRWASPMTLILLAAGLATSAGILGR